MEKSEILAGMLDQEGIPYQVRCAVLYCTVHCCETSLPLTAGPGEHPLPGVRCNLAPTCTWVLRWGIEGHIGWLHAAQLCHGACSSTRPCAAHLRAVFCVCLCSC